MKIGIDALFLRPGKTRGIERVARGLIRGLSGGDDDVVVYAGAEGTGEGGRFRERRAPFSSGNRAARIAFQQAGLGVMASKDGLDVLFCPANLCPPVSFRPSAVMIHDLAPLRFPKDFPFRERLFWRALWPFSVRAARLVLTVSEHSAKEVARTFGIAGSKVRVVHPGVDECFFFSRESPAQAQPKEILCVSKNAGYKNLDGLFFAGAILAQRMKADFNLVIAGIEETDRPGVEARASRLWPGGRLRFTGPLTDAELAARYRRAAMLVNPSFYEGFGLPVLEAMACGTPVVASGALSEAAGDAALLFSPDDPAEMAAAMERVLSDPELAARLREKGKKRAGLFPWDKAVRGVASALHEAARRG
ncbi:MAG: glycosyltransferase family 1 protein [Thermodesulfobacteriota bacterium]